MTYHKHDLEALESVICDVIKIRLKRRIATRSGKGNQPLNIKRRTTNFKAKILGEAFTFFLPHS